MKKIVVALGGNALGNSPKEQKEKVTNAVKPIVELIKQGHQVILAHGNGPQVGMINLAFEIVSLSDQHLSEMPFPECGAMSQGYIGFHLQNALQAELAKNDIDKKVATVITQVEVDVNDPAFFDPTKPIGAFYSKEKADQLESSRGYIMKEDANRGYRRVVPSPKPIGIVEIDVIKTLVDAGHVVITVGGGGIPVVKENNHHIGVPAVIDKDFASAKLAQLLDADSLIILTAVDKVKINFNRPNQQDIDDITASELKNLIHEGHFLRGSMLPKVEAALLFLEGNKKRIAIIAALEQAAEALEGRAGTHIHN
ncbi:MAG: carbamate kinase [Candidatus Izemoplasmatales bacterium]|jgi:carbamate kinase|nr:carbamate kinase [Candidatus Izemoplasmatales bacterium]